MVPVTDARVAAKVQVAASNFYVLSRGARAVLAVLLFFYYDNEVKKSEANITDLAQKKEKTSDKPRATEL